MPSQSSLAAHMLFYEIARRTGDERAAKLVLRAAGSGFTADGSLREFMPLHGGWSDSLFMDIPILAKAGALSGDRRYFDMACPSFRFHAEDRGTAGWTVPASGFSRGRRGGAATVFAALGLALTADGFSKGSSGISCAACGVSKTHAGAVALSGRKRDVPRGHRTIPAPIPNTPERR
jgi:hypothetical protein